MTAHLAASSGETRWTQAVEAAHLIKAAAAVEARRAGALVHVFVTVFAAEARSARTLIAVQQVLSESREDALMQVAAGSPSTQHLTLLLTFELRLL